MPWGIRCFFLDRNMNVHFDYTNWHDSDFDPTDRIKYYEHKYVNKNKEQQDLKLINKMTEFEEKSSKLS